MTFKRDKTKAVLRHLRALKSDPNEFVESPAYAKLYKALYAAGLIVDFNWMEWTDQVLQGQTY